MSVLASRARHRVRRLEDWSTSYRKPSSKQLSRSTVVASASQPACGANATTGADAGAPQPELIGGGQPPVDGFVDVGVDHHGDDRIAWPRRPATAIVGTRWAISQVA
jgi:hypothetical protein